MAITRQPQPEAFTSDKLGEWFDAFISSLRTDEIILKTKIAPKSLEKFYNTMITGNAKEISSLARTQTSMFFIKNIVAEYLIELGKRKSLPVKLAFNHSDAKVLVWAVIKDNDEKTENALLLSEAKVNANYCQNGFHISSTILEESDNYPVPEHYQSII